MRAPLTLKRFTPWVVALTLVGATPVSFAASPEPLDLQKAYALARERDASFQVARAQLEAAREQLPQARARQLPAIGFSSSRTRVQQDRKDESQPFPTQTYVSEADSISLRQPLFNRRIDASVRQAEQSTLAAEASMRRQQADLLVRTTQAYLSVLLAQERLTLVEAQQQSVQSRLLAARGAFAAGTGIRTDIDELAAQLDVLKAQALSARQAILKAKLDLETIVGQPVGTLSQQVLVREGLVRMAQIQPLEHWLSQGLANHPEVEARQRALEAARANLEGAKADRLPTVDLTAQLARSSSENSYFVNSITTNRTVGVQLAVPIYQGGAIDSRERQAVAQVREAEAQLELAQHRVRQEVQQAYFAVKESLDRMEALELAVQSAAQVVVANEQSFKAGLRTTLDIVAAQQREAQARLDLQNARLDLVMGRVRLDVSVGEVDAPR